MDLNFAFPDAFCEKGTLEVLMWPAHTAIRSSRSAVAKSNIVRKMPEGFELMSDMCSNCGKTASDIKKVWNEGHNEFDKERRLKRLEELKRLGFSGRL